ncbi:hypothetical protein EVAR_27602_1 [Eumeta japonica]|uniref:Uncharacterized protein n=1 Tax=Eumeta variegata TaxID=151549 RepID=A0A4C1V0Z7_EUMVA|nr:hypothetical protein EVAR_27602_1 [Eumeta japonica]
MLLLLEAQKCFEKETTLIRGGKAITRKNCLRKLAMKIDENGILRLKEKIKAAMDVSTLNRSSVPSGDNSIAKLIIEHYHEKFNHVKKHLGPWQGRAGTRRSCSAAANENCMLEQVLHNAAVASRLSNNQSDDN